MEFQIDGIHYFPLFHLKKKKENGNYSHLFHIILLGYSILSINILTLNIIPYYPNSVVQSLELQAIHGFDQKMISRIFV